MVEAAARGEVGSMYPSAEARADGIAAGRGASPAVLRADLRGAHDRLVEAWNALPDDAWDRLGRASMTRTMRDFVWVRRREVEVHHVDLDLGYEASDWPVAFVAGALDEIFDTFAQRAAPTRPLVDIDYRVVTTDHDRAWRVELRGAQVARASTTTAARPTAKPSAGVATSRRGCTDAIPAAGESSRPATSACCAFPAGSRSRSRRVRITDAAGRRNVASAGVVGREERGLTRTDRPAPPRWRSVSSGRLWQRAVVTVRPSGLLPLGGDSAAHWCAARRGIVDCLRSLLASRTASALSCISRPVVHVAPVIVGQFALLQYVPARRVAGQSVCRSRSDTCGALVLLNVAIRWSRCVALA